MEAVVAEPGHPQADREVGFEDAAINMNQDEEFDFDIGGPEDNLDTETGAESTKEGLAYQADANDALDNTYTYQEPDESVQHPVEESYDQEDHDEGYGEDAFDTSELDAAAGTGTEEFGENLNGVHPEAVHPEGDKNADQADKDQLEEFELHDDEISYEETAGEFESFDDVAQSNAEQAHGTVDTATSVEYTHHEENQFEAHVDAEDDIDALVEGNILKEMVEDEVTMAGNFDGKEHVVHRESHTVSEDESSNSVRNDRELLSEVNPADEMGEIEVAEAAEATIAIHSNDSGHADGSEEHADAEDDMPVAQEDAGPVDGSLAAADWVEDGHEDQQHPDEQPNPRVFWRSEEFRLFAESPDDDPDTYFFKDDESLRQPLSQFLSGLRQVIANELAPSEELFVKVDGLGLEFGETTTASFIEKITFGQILDLRSRLLEFDDGSESHELYLYLDARPSCLHRFDELTKGAQEGLGLSHLALYYEDASTDMPADEDEEDQYEGPRDIYSDDVSLNESIDEQQEDSHKDRQAEQSFNPFSITEAQRHAIETAPSVAEEGGEKNSPSADRVGAHGIDDGTGDTGLVPGEDQDGLDLDATDDMDYVPIDEDLQGTMSGLDEAKDVATEELGEDYGDGGDDEDAANDEIVGEEGDTIVLEEDSREKHDPTDGKKPSFYKSSECSAPQVCCCDECMSSEPTSPYLRGGLSTNLGLASQVSGYLLPRDGYSGAQHEACAIRDSIGCTPLAARDLETFITDPSSFLFKENNTANLHFQDHDAAENDDYLDIGNVDDNVDTADNQPYEYAEHAVTPGPITHDSSATATLDGDDHGNEDGAHVAHDLVDASHAVEASNQPDADPSQNELDEIDWKEEGEDDEDDVADQNSTDPSLSSISVKRSRQEDEDNDGPGDESSKSWYRRSLRMRANMLSAVKRRRT